METPQIILMVLVCPSTSPANKTMKFGFLFFFIDVQQKLRISQVYHYIHWEELTSVSEALWLYFNLG